MPKMTLGEAAYQNSMRIVRQLIEAGADPNVSEDGLVPLREACFNENIPMIKYLLGHGANPNERDPDCGQSILESFIWSYRRVTPIERKITKISKKPYPYDRPANRAVLRRLLRAGADPNLPTNALRPVFHEAIFKNVKRVVAIFLEHGADMNQRGKVHDGETPLMTAAYFADISIMKMLLKHGADVNALDGEGHNALFYVVAGMCPWQEVLPRFKLLFKYGIDLRARDKHGKNILQYGSRLNKTTRHWLYVHGVKGGE